MLIFKNFIRKQTSLDSNHSLDQGYRRWCPQFNSLNLYCELLSVLACVGMFQDLAKKLGLNYKAVARGAMLHDLFLYDWRNSKKALKLRKLHAFIHPEIALENSLKLFYLTEKEKDIILKHMWPVTIKLPKYPESYIVTFTDKYSTIVESLYYYTDILHTKKFYKYAYIFLSLIVFRII